MKSLATLTFVICLFVSGVSAQDITATIEGTVLDTSGSAIPKAKVTITNTDRNQVLAALTADANGVYSAPLLPIGTYKVSVEAMGFKTNTQTGVVLNAKDVLKVNVTMQ